MSEEEYLRACGWVPRQEGGWDPPLRSSGGPTYDVYSSPWKTADAVKKQLAEDRARLAFVLARSDRAALGIAGGDDIFGSAAFARGVGQFFEETLAEGEVNEDT